MKVAARFDVLKSLEDLRVTLDRKAMARQWKTEQRKLWEDNGIAVSQEELGKVDFTLDNARALTAAETYLPHRRLS
jgi:hypothetical protein